jgi:uncharacterized membrane protein YdcZ (DUF606 family)
MELDLGHAANPILRAMEHHQLAWYVAGPVLGVCVVACRILFNARLGVTGGSPSSSAAPRTAAR